MRAERLPMLLVPGAGLGKAGCWGNWPGYFRKFGYESHEASLPGIGNDSRNLASVSLEDDVGAIRRQMAELGDCIVLGSSKGGLETLAACANMPYPRAVVLVGSALPEIFGGLTWTAVGDMVTTSEYLSSTLRHQTFQFRNGDLSKKFVNRADKPQEAIRHFGHVSGLQIEQLALGRLKVQLREIRCPILVVAGIEDQVIDLDAQKRFFRKLQSSRPNWAAVSGFFAFNCGHLPMLEGRGVDRMVANSIAAWLSDLGSMTMKRSHAQAAE